ncbi:MAG: hypothetical protein NTW30_04905 [Candidatus Aenigmarchaeota archaeon]|nr:hypothetical protein [Candidatus Aenigmarchaeota archaeon]
MYYDRLSIDQAMSANLCTGNLFRHVMIFGDVYESGLEENFRERYEEEAPDYEAQKLEFMTMHQGDNFEESND